MLWNPRQVGNQFRLYITSLVTNRILLNLLQYFSNIVDSLLNYENVKLYTAESFEGKKNELNIYILIHSCVYFLT